MSSISKHYSTLFLLLEDSDNSRKSKDTKTTASVEKTETQRGTKRPADKEEAPAVKVEIKEELTDQDTGIQITVNYLYSEDVNNDKQLNIYHGY